MAFTLAMVKIVYIQLQVHPAFTGKIFTTKLNIIAVTSDRYIGVKGVGCFIIHFYFDITDRICLDSERIYCYIGSKYRVAHHIPDKHLAINNTIHEQ
jgi:hypothetical protein